MTDCRTWEREPMSGKRMKKMWNTGDGKSRFGIWNSMKKEFQFGICEPTPKKARDKLFKKIGYNSYKWRFEVCAIKQKEGDKE